MTDDERPVCPDPKCGELLAEHIGGKPCVVGAPSTARSLHDLPVFGWAWRGDGRADRRGR